MSIASTVSSTVASTVGKSLGRSGGGGVLNLLTHGEQFDNVAWGKSGSDLIGPLVTANAATAPNGQMTAEQVVYPTVSGASDFSVVFQGFTAVIGQEYTSSIYLRGDVGGEVVYLMRTPDGVTYSRVQCVLTTSWQQFTVSWTATATTEYFQFGVDRRDSVQGASSAMTIFAWDARVVVGGGGGGGPVLLTGDRYVSTTGSDSNDGLTRTTAWLTMGKLAVWANALTAGTHSAVIVAGSYTETTNFSLTNQNAVFLTLEFEEGVTVDSSAAVTRVEGFDVQNGSAGLLTVNLRGAQYFGNAVSSANGIGTNNVASVVFNGATSSGVNAVFSGFDDGVSFHGVSGTADKIVINDCDFTNSPKSAFAHVAASCGTHNRCRFYGKAAASLGIGTDDSTESSQTIFNDCQFIPATASQSVCFGGATVTGGRIGTLTVRADIVQRGVGDVNPLLDSVFVNAFIDGNVQVRMDECFGYLSCRQRNGTGNIVLTSCVFAGGAVGNTNGLHFRNYDPGSSSGWSAVDCIITGFNTAIGMDFIASNATYFVNAANKVNYCCLHNNTTNYDADLISAGADISTGNITTDPLLAAGGTYDKADWGYTAGSPCIGAGLAGGNIGFAAA